MATIDDLQALRDAYDDACAEVANECERSGFCPQHVIAHAEALRRAIVETEEEAALVDATFAAYALVWEDVAREAATLRSELLELKTELQG